MVEALGLSSVTSVLESPVGPVVRTGAGQVAPGQEAGEDSLLSLLPPCSAPSRPSLTTRPRGRTS